ncbi:hypothetical protein [Nocardia sp. NPDC051463]|uniref:hypothetical protein n=1 Tax=Nocardia sp. NPDC051463 TaxID=3154845 RepID=UPI00344E7D9B
MKHRLTRAIGRLMGRKVPAGTRGGRDGPDSGGTAGIREPRQPIPPEDPLSATRPFTPDPDPKTIILPPPMTPPARDRYAPDTPSSNDPPRTAGGGVDDRA